VYVTCGLGLMSIGVSVGKKIKILKHCAYTCCCDSHAAASFDFGRVADVRRMPARPTSSKAATPRYIHTAAPGRSEAGQSNRRRATEAGTAERIRSNARHPDKRRAAPRLNTKQADAAVLQGINGFS